jgi:hypothetical protein
MNVEKKLAELGLAIPDLEALYKTNASGAHYISHYPVHNLLYLSGTTPRRDGRSYLPGVVGQDLTLEQGYDAARYAVLTTLAAVKYALGDLDRVQQIVQSTCSASGASRRGPPSAVRDSVATRRWRSSSRYSSPAATCVRRWRGITS